MLDHPRSVPSRRSKKLPPDATFEDAVERLYLLAKIERGLAQVEAGDTIPHDQAKARLTK